MHTDTHLAPEELKPQINAVFHIVAQRDSQERGRESLARGRTDSEEFRQTTYGISLQRRWPWCAWCLIIRWGQTHPSRSWRIRPKSPSWKPPGNAAQRICLRWLCVRVWPLTLDSVWPLRWQATVAGAPVWAEHATTNWASARRLNMCINLM